MSLVTPPARRVLPVREHTDLTKHPDYAGRCGECGAVALMVNTTWWDCVNPYCMDTKSMGLKGDS